MLNQVTIVGHLGNQPEMRFTPNGNPVTSFRVATSRYFKDQEGQRKTETEWFTVVTWNKLAEACNEHLDKGKRVYVQGRLRSRSWDNNDGQKRTVIEIVAERVLFLDKNPSAQRPANGRGTSKPASQTEAAAPMGEEVVEDETGAEDIPF